MPETYRPLFPTKLLASRMAGFHPLPTLDQLQLSAQWAKTAADPAFRQQKEKPLQGQFLQELFARVLGYTPAVGHLDGYHLKAESASTETKGGKTPDGRLGWFAPESDTTRVVIELKAPAADLDARQPGYGGLTPVEQAFGYLAKFDDCRWVIVSNLREVRLYSKQRGQGYAAVWSLERLGDQEELRRFVFLLGRDRLLAPPPALSPVDKLLAESTAQQQEITHRFYLFYRDLRLKVFRQFVTDHPCPAGTSQADHELALLTLAQKLLDRVLFICFCEDAGLLPHGVLRHALAEALTGFVPTTRWQQLRGLFQAVDQGLPPMHIHGYNGGLFRADPALDQLTVRDELLVEVLLLTDYDFATDLNVNILGHIFEQSITDLEALRATIQGQAVDPTQTKRKHEGVFYTPEYITQYIVAETIGGCLHERWSALAAAREATPATTAKARLQADLALWEGYRDALRQLKVLDPACGSGAFLVAAFDFLHAEYIRVNHQLAELRGDQPSLFDLDRQILQENLFGVDLNHESVEITKLALWLKTASIGKPLNNLDANILCGNSVVAPAPDLPPALAARAFPWHERFPQVFGPTAPGGFDVVIGNPPYIRQEWLAPYKPSLQREFACFAGTADLYLYFFARGLQLLRPGGRLGFITSGSFHNANFAAPFRQWLPTVARFTHVLNFGENQPFEEAEMVYPTISLLRKDPSPRAFRYLFLRQGIPDSLAKAMARDGIDCDDEVFRRPEWRFQAPAVSRLFDRLMATGQPLGHAVGGRLYRGVLTGLNEAFIVDQATRDQMVAADPGCAPLLKKLLRGEDLRPWYYEDEGRWLIFTRRGIDIEQYPAIKAHLEQFRPQLEPRPADWAGKPAAWTGRKPGAYRWFELQDTIDYYPAFDEPKVLWPDIAKLPRFSWDEEGVYVNDKGFIVASPPRWLHAVLQSRVSWFCISQVSTPLRLRGGLWQSQCKKQFIERLPIPFADEAAQTALAALAEQATTSARERYALHQQVRHRLRTDLGDGTGQLNQKLTAWWELDFKTLRAEVRKALRGDIPLAARADWEATLAQWQERHRALTATLVAAEEELNDRVATLFGLTTEERTTLATHLEQAQLAYPLGEV